MASAPSEAQVRFGIGPDGPSVRVGPDRDRYERDRYVERRYYRDDDLTTGSIRGDCRTIVKRVQRPNGTTVTTRERRC